MLIYHLLLSSSILSITEQLSSPLLPLLELPIYRFKSLTHCVLDFCQLHHHYHNHQHKPAPTNSHIKCRTE